MSTRRLLIAAGLAVIFLTGWLAYDWQPDRQLEKVTQRLLTALEKRDWERVRDLMATDYADEWGLDRTTAIQAASEGLQQFFYLTLAPSDWQVARSGDNAEVSCLLTIDGHGTGLAQVALNRLTELEEPFTFRWRKESWKPWDWRLYSAAQPELQLPREYLLP